MEVHAHSHTPRKKWTHYFWEFLMLFLAVFCGFLAENQREHYIEHQRAKQFARSLLEDLKADTVALNAAITFSNIKVNMLDSFLIQIVLPEKEWKDTLIYKYSSVAGRVKPFERSSGTYEQIKASGSLRYFSQPLTDLLIQYDVQTKKVETRESISLKYTLDYLVPLQFQIMDMRPVVQLQDGIAITYPLIFRKQDKETIALWINYITTVQSAQKRTWIEYKNLLGKAQKIISLFQKEYHLK